jgi:hypothetical protein
VTALPLASSVIPFASSAIPFASSALFRMFYSSLLAGVGAAIVFSLTVYGAIRSSDMRREGRGGAAAAYAALAACGLIVSAGSIVFGLILVAHKS